MASPQMIYFCVSWATALLKSRYSPDISGAGRRSLHYVGNFTHHSSGGNFSEETNGEERGVLEFGGNQDLESDNKTTLEAGRGRVRF